MFKHLSIILFLLHFSTLTSTHPLAPIELPPSDPSNTTSTSPTTTVTHSTAHAPCAFRRSLNPVTLFKRLSTNPRDPSGPCVDTKFTLPVDTTDGGIDDWYSTLSPLDSELHDNDRVKEHGRNGSVTASSQTQDGQPSASGVSITMPWTVSVAPGSGAEVLGPRPTGT